MSFLGRVGGRLADLETAALRRSTQERPGDPGRDFTSNDYLGLSRHPDVVQALRAATAAGSGGSRLLAGTHPEHIALEVALARWIGRDAALLFSSGYLAMLGAVAAVAPFFRIAYSDELNHACAIDALRLTKLPCRIYPHLALPSHSRRESAALVVTESLFSMRATQVSVCEVVAELGPDDAAIVDEAHALGVVGHAGTGIAANVNDPRLLIVGTLSKALGTLGGFVAGPAEVIALLQNDARTFMFDTALPPAIAAAAHAALNIAAGAEGDARRARLAHHAERVAAAAANISESNCTPCGAIVPIVIGDTRTTLAFSRALKQDGIFAPAIRPPTVPAGRSQIRIILRADHTEADVDHLLLALGRARCAAL